jgi:LETM1 and EF-hand domain-containing protein 1, mitochondrial
MSVFVVIPFMELLLPVALKIFPNMLPSTFEDSLQKEDAMKRELQMRLAMAGFMKDMLREMAKDVAKKGTEASAAEVTSFVEKAKLGNMVNEDIFKFAKVFRDDLTLDNMSRTQLVTMCTFMNIQPYGADAFIRFKLRSHIRDIQVLVSHTSHVDVDIFNMYLFVFAKI